jgi:hypothetical protein
MFSRRQLLLWICAHPMLASSSIAGIFQSSAPDNRTDKNQVNELLKLLITTPRDNILETLAAKIQHGIRYNELLTALTLAGVYHIEPYLSVGFKYHAVMMLSAVNQTAAHSPLHERWLPLLWAADVFKREQLNDTFKGDWTLSSNISTQTRSSNRPQDLFTQAMNNWDAQAADTAIVHLIRHTKLDVIFEQLFYYGARDFRHIGHKTITVSNSHRLIKQLGAEYAEPILRSTVYALQNHTGDANPAKSDLSADQPWRKNQTFASQFPQHWQHGHPDPQATVHLLPSLRQNSYNDVSLMALDMLKKSVHPSSVWDAVILSAGELIMRSSGIISVHANTSINALYYAYEHSQTDTNKRLLLLQALSFITLFRDLLPNQQRALNINSFEPLPTSAKGRQRYIEIFEQVSDQREKAARNVLHVLQQGGSAASIITLGRRHTVFQNTGYHDYKFTEAIFENASRLSGPWQARLLGASIFYLNGSRDKSNEVVLRAKSFLVVGG